MDRSEFDRFADEYRTMHACNVRVSGESPEYFADYKIKDLAALGAEIRPGRRVERILDFGAGVGNSVQYFQQYFSGSRLTCVDVSERSLCLGQERHPGAAQFVVFNGRVLPFADHSFDVVFTACVFHHIPADEHLLLLRELRRVLVPGGLFCVFEHNPINPLTRSVVRDCPFDENAVLIRGTEFKANLSNAGFDSPRVRYRMFFPRALAWLRGLERFLTWLPLGAQYYVYSLRN